MVAVAAAVSPIRWIADQLPAIICWPTRPSIAASRKKPVPLGAGNRNVVITYIFKNSTNGGTTPNGTYTDAWLVNVASGASNATTGLFVGNYVAHEINTPMSCNNSNNITASVTIRI